MKLVRSQPRNPAAFDALARIYWVTDHQHKAIDVLEASKKIDPRRGETYYIGAEVILDLPDQGDLAIQWARYAEDLGCGLSRSILGPGSHRRRSQYRSPKLSTITGYTPYEYVKRWAKYYEDVPVDELEDFIGPNPISAGKRGLR